MLTNIPYGFTEIFYTNVKNLIYLKVLMYGNGVHLAHTSFHSLIVSTKKTIQIICNYLASKWPKSILDRRPIGKGVSLDIFATCKQAIFLYQIYLM